jgi:hypothetical protein
MSKIASSDWDEIWDYSRYDVPTRPGHVVLHEWSESNEGETELDCAAVILDTFGQYYSVEAWTDYTDWGCHYGIEWNGPFASVLAAVNALSQEHRRRLGFEHAPNHGDIYRD